MTQQRRLLRLYISICLGTLAVGASIYYVFFRNKAYTDDSYVQGNQVWLTPLVPGFVETIFTDDTYLVTKGQVLVQLDTTDATIALEQAKEDLAFAVRKVCGQFHEVFALQASIEVQKAELVKTAQDFEHRNEVVSAGGVSVEDYEHSEAALRSAFFLLQKTEILMAQALSLVQGTSIISHPEVVRKADIARQAFVNLHRCKIYSPVEGLVAQRNIQVGMWVKQGDPLLAVIPLDQIWVNANFKETQMKKMRIGQRVTLYSDLYGKEVPFHGTIAGLPGGAGNAFSILPPQNLSGNWIKIVQRLPVRIDLDMEELVDHPLRIGLSMEAWADLSTDGLLVPTSTEGSPTYNTNIFADEETGDITWIDEIIKANADPSLTAFLQHPLLWDKK
jgi:membrane fusion protein (multidrug efflux system)